MGAWGTGISSNDTFADIYDDFFECYNSGSIVSEITKRLIQENQETINESGDSNNFWFAIALAQWECKELSIEIFEKVKQIINSGDDLIVWKNSDARDADIKSREIVLKKFLAKLETEKVNPKRRKINKLYDSVFKKNDCLTYIMENGNYGGAFVLTDELQSSVGGNFIAITTIDQNQKPTIEQFKKAEVYIQRVKTTYFEEKVLKEKWIDQPQIGLFMGCWFKKENINIEVIGQIKIHKDYKRENTFSGFPWRGLLIKIPLKKKYIEINGEPKTKIKLTKWTKKYWL